MRHQTIIHFPAVIQLTALHPAGKIQDMAVLITETDTPLGEELLRLYLKKGSKVVGARSVADTSQPDSNNKDLLIVPWKRKSIFSTRNLILQAQNRFDRIDEALILETPAVEKKPIQELSCLDIEMAVDEWIKGNLFLLREILLYFKNRTGGVLALIDYSEHSGGMSPPLESALRGSFRSIARSIFSSSSQENVFITGFESDSLKIPEFAEFIAGTLEEKGKRVRGKWFRFQTGPGLLSPFRGRR